MQTRKQFETRTSAGRDSDTLMRAEPLPAPPTQSRIPAFRWASALLVALTTLVALPLQGHAVTLVSTLGQDTDLQETMIDSHRIATKFTVGPHSGFTVTSVIIKRGSGGQAINMAIHAVDTSNTDNPVSAALYSFTRPSTNASGNRTFTAPTGATMMRVAPSASGRGLTLSIAPQWGRTGSTTQRLWAARDASALGGHSAFEADNRLSIDAGYGFALVHGRGVLTPYAGLTLGDGATRTIRTGMRWQVAPDARFGLEGTQRADRRGRRRERNPATSRASLLKTTGKRTTAAPDRDRTRSLCMRWGTIEKTHREDRTSTNGSQATPALGVEGSGRTQRREHPMQTRKQCGTRTGAGTDSDTLVRVEPVRAPPPDPRQRLATMRETAGGRACSGTAQAAGTLAASARHLTAGLLLAFAALVALLPEARAQTTVKMVGNGTASTTYSYLGTDSSGDYRELAQRFTTGSNAAGYTLSTAAIWFGALPTNAADITNFVAAIYTDTSNRPGTLKYALTNPSGNFATTGQKNFSAPSDSTLDAGTKYWLVLMNDNATDGYNVTAVSTDSAEDNDSLAGWSIANQRFQRSSRSGSWTSWASELQIRVSGYENTPLPELSFAQQVVVVNEDAGPVTLTVELDPASATTVTVDYATQAVVGAAQPGEDYTTTSGTLTFAATETSKTFTIPILNDDIYENNESFFVDLSDATGATVPAPRAAITINSEDAKPTASVEDVTVDEGAGTMTATIRLSHPSQPDITYLAHAIDVTGTATEGDDYDDFLLGPGRTAEFTVPGRELSQSFDISIVDDNANESDETIVIEWHKISSSEVTPDTLTFTGTITDNDTPLPQLSLSSRTISVDEEAGPAVVTVSLAPASTGTVTVDYATRDSTAGLAQGGKDYTATSGTLSFAPGETSKTITIEILGDDIYEGLERFVTELSNPSGATLPEYPGQTIEIVSDEAVPTAQMTPVTLNEGGGTMVLTLRLSHPSGEEISYLTIDDQVTEVTGTATEGEDYDDFLLEAGRRASITVPAGSVSQTFSISIVDDNLEEPDETIRILWQKDFNHTVTPQDFVFTGTIEDNDEGAGAARGKPRITGTAEVGQTLTISTADISDQHGNTKAENGNAGFAYTYQWYRIDAGAETPITGAKGRESTYTLAQADAGKQFAVEVSFTDDARNSEGPLKSNEYPPNAENGELRLADGPSTSQGRLEVFHAGEWGTVCDDQFDERVDDPRTLHDRRRFPNLAPIKACQFMGYATGEMTPRGNISMAPPAQRTWLDDVRCLDDQPHWTGSSPTKLHHCYHAGWGLENCTHEEDVHLSCTGLLEQTETPPLTATLEDMPTNHDGSSAFTFRLAFSADIDITPENMRDNALIVSGATVTDATRVDGRSDLWEVTLEPTASNAVSILVPLNRACTEPGALCTAQGGMLTIAPAQSIPGPAQGPQTPQGLKASFAAVPGEHDGETKFWLELTFDAALAEGSKPRLKALLAVTGGSVKRLRRKDRRLDHWQIKIQPSSHEAVTVTLAPSPPCAQTGAVCTDDGRTFTTGITTQIQGPPGLSIADAQVQEGPNATLAFPVTLSRAPSSTVTVDYATSDGTATAGSDYTARSGTLSFGSGETEKTVSVPVLDDGHDEGSENLTLTLSNPSGAYLADRSATGTINNSDPMPLAWMVRFGRTVGSQVVDALGQRLDGATASHVTVGGINLTGEPGAAPEAQSDDPFGLPEWAKGTQREKSEQSLTANELLLGSAFHLSSGGDQGEGPAYTAWGRVARSGFEAEVDDVTMDADVTSGLIGFDAEWERVLAGVMLSQSSGEGSYRLSAEQSGGAGSVKSSLSGVYPYARVSLNARMSAWALAGAASGELALKEEGDAPMPAGITMRMGAVGFKGQVLDGTDASGLAMNVKSDAMWVGTQSERTADMVATQGDVRRLRVIVEGERAFDMGGGATLTPSAEVGLRHDAGDAETGTGLEMGAGLSYAAGPLTVEGQVRMLVAHEESGYEEWGASGAMRITPSASGRGLTLSIAPQWGRTRSATEQLWSAPDATALGTDRVFEGDARLALDAGYGVGVGHGVLTPYASLTLGDGGARTSRTGLRWQVAPDVVFGLAGIRHVDATNEGENEVRLRAALRF